MQLWGVAIQTQKHTQLQYATLETVSKSTPNIWHIKKKTSESCMCFACCCMFWSRFGVNLASACREIQGSMQICKRHEFWWLKMNPKPCKSSMFLRVVCMFRWRLLPQILLVFARKCKCPWTCKFPLKKMRKNVITVSKSTPNIWKWKTISKNRTLWCLDEVFPKFVLFACFLRIAKDNCIFHQGLPVSNVFREAPVQAHAILKYPGKASFTTFNFKMQLWEISRVLGIRTFCWIETLNFHPSGWYRCCR